MQYSFVSGGVSAYSEIIRAGKSDVYDSSMSVSKSENSVESSSSEEYVSEPPRSVKESVKGSRRVGKKERVEMKRGRERRMRKGRGRIVEGGDCE